jgi:ribosomal-protein-alanine N-acetyltransferase
MSESQLPFHVESMRWEDVPQVMEIEQEAFPLPWPERAYRYELNENKNSHYYVVRRSNGTPLEGHWNPFKALWQRNGRPPVLGYGGFWLIAGETHISTIAIREVWRGHGLGELLLWYMLERGREMGAFEATLEVRVSNHVAQNLYRKYGFQKVGQRRRYYQDNGEDAFIMTVRDFDTRSYRNRMEQLGQALRRRLRRAFAD